MLHEKSHSVLNGFTRDNVVVVQHEEERVAVTAGQFAQQEREHCGQRQAWQTVRSGEERTSAGPKGGITGLEGCQHSREEAQRVVVLRIQGQPGGGHPALSQKLRQQRGFPEASRGTQQDEGLPQTLPEALEEASAMNQPGRRAGHVEPGGQQRAERIVRHGDLHNWWPFHDGDRPGRGSLCRRDDGLGCGWRLLWPRKSGAGWFISGPLSLQQTGDLLQPGEGQVSGLTEILLAQLVTRTQISIPVAITPLHRLLTCSIRAGLTVKGKGGDPGQPGKPGGSVRHQREGLTALLSRQFIGL